MGPLTFGACLFGHFDCFGKPLSILESDRCIQIGFCDHATQWVIFGGVCLLCLRDRLFEVDEALLVLASSVFKFGLSVVYFEQEMRSVGFQFIFDCTRTLC